MKRSSNITEKEKDSKGSEKTVKIFALASFLNDMGSDIIYPIWPIFVTSVLNAPMTILGFIDGLGDAIVSVSQAISGYISDKIRKRKVFVWSGYFLGFLSRIGYAFSATWHHLIPFRVLDRFGKIRAAPRDAIVADISNKQNRGRNFGLIRAADNLGALLGIILCFLLLGILGYRNLFLLASIPSLLSVLLIIFFVKESSRKTKRIYKGISLKDLSKNFRLFLFLNAIFALGSFSYSFLMIFAKEFGFSEYYLPLLYLLFTLIASIFSLPFGKLSDKIGRKNVLLISYFLWILVCFTIVNASFAKELIILSFFLYGMHKGSFEPAQKAFVSELSNPKYRASSLGLFQMIVGLCALPSSLIAGILWDKISLFAPFYLSIFLTLISIGILGIVKTK